MEAPSEAKKKIYSAFLGPILGEGVTEPLNNRAVRNQAVLVRDPVFISAVQPQDVRDPYGCGVGI